MTLSGFKDSVMELIHFVGRLASVGLQLEGCHCLLLSFVLDFYETVKKEEEAGVNDFICFVIICVCDLLLSLCSDTKKSSMFHHPYFTE